MNPNTCSSYRGGNAGQWCRIARQRPVAPADHAPAIAGRETLATARQKPSFETLKALGLAKLTDLAKENVDAQTRVKNSADKFKKTAKEVGKILAAMKVAYADAQDKNALSRGAFFEDYPKSVTGEGRYFALRTDGASANCKRFVHSR